MVLTCKHQKVRCDITATLDAFLYGLNNIYYVYIPEEDVADKKERFLAIRRPGRTIGEIEVDEHDVIINVRISEHGMSSFKEDMNKVLKKYVGERLERDEICYYE